MIRAVRIRYQGVKQDSYQRAERVERVGRQVREERFGFHLATA
jgi:hypothetical protein